MMYVYAIGLGETVKRKGNHQSIIYVYQASQAV